MLDTIFVFGPHVSQIQRHVISLHTLGAFLRVYDNASYILFSSNLQWPLHVLGTTCANR